MDLDSLMVLVLVVVRVGCVFAFLPFFSQGRAPRAIKALAVVAVSAVLWPVAGQAPPVGSWQPVQFALFAAAEATFGLLLGAGAQMLFLALRHAGEMFGQQMGMALAAVADPVHGDQSTLVGTFCLLVGTLVFFGAGGHLMMVRALHESFAQWPLGAFLAPEFIRRVSVEAVAHSFVMALQLASPLLLLTFMVSLTMAVMARLVPEMNILIIGFPVRIGVGLVGLTLFVPLLVRYAGEVSRVMIQFMTGVAAGA